MIDPNQEEEQNPKLHCFELASETHSLVELKEKENGSNGGISKLIMRNRTTSIGIETKT